MSLGLSSAVTLSSPLPPSTLLPYPSPLTPPFIPPGKQVALPRSTCLREEEGRTWDWRTWTLTQRGRKETHQHCHASASSPGTEWRMSVSHVQPFTHTCTCTHIHMHATTGSISIYGHHVAPMPTSSCPLPPVWTGTVVTVAPHCVTQIPSSRAHITGSGASRQTRR